MQIFIMYSNINKAYTLHVALFSEIINAFIKMQHLDKMLLCITVIQNIEA